MTEWFFFLQDWLQPVSGGLVMLLPPDSPLHQITIAGCVLLLISIIGHTPSRLALVRQSLLLLAACAALVLLLALLKLLPEATWVQAVIWPAGLVLMGGVLGKLALANRFAALRDARHDPRGRVDSILLPFQKRATEKLLEQAVLAATPLVLGLQALWGAGKSTTMDHFLQALNAQDDRFVAVRLNVWEYEDYPDLQFGVMQALLAHPKVLERYGWLNFPLWMLAREWGGLRFGAFKFSWGQTTADANGNLHLPWQSRFERIVARQHLAGRRVVFVLDEIDRASAPSAQSVLTLITRSLALPGVVAVLPFVEEVIRFKTFHPDMVELDDLRDTVTGYLHQKWLDADGLQVPGPDQESAPCRSICQDRAVAFGTLAGQFMKQASPTAWIEYYRQMEERYLRHRVYMGKPDGRDVLALLQFPEVRAGFVAGFGLEKFQALLEWVAEQVEKRDSPLRNLDIQIRLFKGDLLQLLSAPVSSSLDPRFFLMLALAMAR